jgi:hypothetical protein
MATKKKTKNTHVKKNWAAQVLQAQKNDYKRIFSEEVKKAKDPKKGAKRAGEIYRSRYGATPAARWKHALKAAK